MWSRPKESGIQSSQAPSSPSNILENQWKLTEHIVSWQGGHHIASYDRFLEQRLPELVMRCFDLRGDDRQDSRGDGKSAFYIRCSNVQVKRPTVINEGRPLLPQECRLRRLSYTAPVEADFEWRFGPDEAPQRKNIKICDVPVLLRCCRCHLSPDSARFSKDFAAFNGEDLYDPGGYFIVNGTEKVLLALEQSAFNKIIVRNESGIISAEVVSNGVERKTKTIVCMKEKKLYLQAGQLRRGGANVAAVFKAMGLVADQLIVRLVGSTPASQEALQLTLLECKELGVKTQREALGYLAGLLGPRDARGQRRTAVHDVLDWLANSLFCHIPTPITYRDIYIQQVAQSVQKDAGATTEVSTPGKRRKSITQSAAEPAVATQTRHTNATYNFQAKQTFLAQVVQKVIQAHITGSRGSDRDYFGNKSILLAGDTMALVFEEACKDLARILGRKLASLATSRRDVNQLSNLASVFASAPITSNILKPLSSGTVQLERLKYTFPGCVQVLSRFCIAGAAGHVTKLTSTFDKSLKATGPRMLANSQLGICCLSDTPEGESVGIIKAFAMLARVSLAWPDESETAHQKVIPMLYALGVVPNGIFDIKTVIINGKLKNGKSNDTTSLEDIIESQQREETQQSVLQDQVTAFTQANVPISAAVSVDGYRIGSHCDAVHLMSQIRYLRRTGAIGRYVSVYWDSEDQTICISCGSGRACRPFIIVDQIEGKSVPRLTNRDIRKVEQNLLSVYDLFQLGKLEYLDVNEQACSKIAFSPLDLQFSTYTHLEIDTAAFYGVVASLVPFPHHNQSPRNAFQCAMGKQALGAPFLNIRSRFDAAAYELAYPQAPLVSSRMARRCALLLSLPAGTNAILAVQAAGGHDIEDALVFNRASADRGYGRAAVLKSHEIDMEKQILAGQPSELRQAIQQPTYKPQSDSAFDHFAPPGHSDNYNQSGVYNKNPYKTRLPDRLRRFHAIGPDGVAEIGAKIEDGDVVVVKARTPTIGNQNQQDIQITQEDVIDVPLKMPLGEQGVIDAVALVEGKQRFVRLRTREVRPPFYGDKFSSRHGQKGTVGLIAKQTDLPFCMSTGIIPDQIMNPHGFPSRMTVGKMLELLSGKEAALAGKFAEGGLFCAARASEVCTGLLERGFSYSGRDLLISGITGVPQRCYVFQGPVFYQRLKHMVSDKMHARATGPRKFDTRQPTEGRAQDGGLRLGEMEKDCFVAYGAAAALHERMVTSSDAFDAAVCQNCGLIAAFVAPGSGAVPAMNNTMNFQGLNGYLNKSNEFGNIQSTKILQTGPGTAAGYCQHCKGGNVAQVTLPYAAKLLTQELLAMGLVMRAKLD